MKTDFFARNQNRIIVFSIVLLAILIKGLYFNYYVLGEVLPDSGKSTLYFLYRLIISLSMQMSAALFIASFVFLFRKDYWIIILNLLVDLWLVSCHVYYKVNDLFIFVETIKLAGNLTDGDVLSSATPFLPGCAFYVIVSVIAAIAVILTNKKIIYKENNKRLRQFIFCVVMSFLFLFVYQANLWRINIICKNPRYGVLAYKSFLPYSSIYLNYAKLKWNADVDKWPKEYISYTSIYHFFPAIFVFQMCMPDDDGIKVSEQEVVSFIGTENNETLKGNLNSQHLIILLVESLESWPINGTGQLEHVCERLNEFSHSENVLFCSNVKSQVKQGVSGDGQMILNTGLLPTSCQPACQVYANRYYPNYASLFDNSVLISPWSHIWNQENMTKRYGYKRLIEPCDKKTKWNDSIVIDKMINQLEKYKNSSFCLLGLTVSTHRPFKAQERGTIEFDPSVKDKYANYLNCLNYTDRCIGRLIDYIVSDSIYKNSIFVIIGDHTIFRSHDMSNILSINGINMNAVSKHSTYMPLFIYSPTINQNKFITNLCYQMDVYPTILDLLGINNYYWKGFGVSVLNDTVTRTISENKAFDLSDRIIRSDYFAKKFGIKK